MCCLAPISVVVLIVQERAITALELALEKTAGLGARIDLVLAMVRIGLFFNDNELTTANITKATESVGLQAPGPVLITG